MTVQELYQYVKDAVERNSTYRGSSITKRQFVDSYNTSIVEYVYEMLENRNSDMTRYISDLRTFKDIKFLSETERYSLFEKPDNYLSFIDLYCEFDNSECKITSEYLQEIKPEEANIYYTDPNYEPSFEYGESMYCLSGEGVIIYKKDFNIKKATLSYYREPIEIDIKGYIKRNGEDSKDINPTDIQKPVLIKIGDMIALRFMRSTNQITK